MPQYTLPDGRVVNGSGFELDGIAYAPNWLDLASDADLASRGIAKSETPPPIPLIISDRQFFQQLATSGIITVNEALAAVGPGDIPVQMLTIIDAMPEAERFPARMLLAGATQFDRTHPLVAAFALAMGWDQAQIDGFWMAASAL